MSELGDALAAFEAGGAPDDYIAAAQEERARFAGQKASKPISFGRVAGPLRTRLQGFADHDRATRARIESMQAQREQALARLRGDLGKSSDDLTKIQEMVEKTIESTSWSVRRLATGSPRWSTTSESTGGSAGASDLLSPMLCGDTPG